jgi:hypothetical protein
MVGTLALGVALIAALLCVAASSAMAFSSPEWLVNGTRVVAEQKVETKNQTVTFRYVGSGGYEFEYKCKAPSEGGVSGVYYAELGLYLGKLKLAKTTVTTCEVLHGSCPTQHTVEWYGGESALEGEAAKPWVTGGALKMKVVCSGGVESRNEECSATQAKGSLKNLSGGGVEAEFKPLVGGSLQCALASGSQSWIGGNITIKATESKKLSVS